MPKLSNDVINAAIEGFENQKRSIDARIVELRAMLNGSTAEESASMPIGRSRRKMSVAARKRIAQAQRKRWAAVKGSAKTPAAPKKKRRLSAAGRAAIIAATKKRWAAERAAKKRSRA